MKPILGTMRGFLLTATLAPAYLFAAVTPASAYLYGPRPDVVRYLDTVFEEKPAAFGVLAGGEQLAELFVSRRGSWTLLVSLPRGHACVLASGDGWATLSDPGAAGPEA